MKKIIIAGILCIVLGIAVYLIQKEYIVMFRTPTSSSLSGTITKVQSVASVLTLVTDQGTTTTTTETRTVTGNLSPDILSLLQQWTHTLRTLSQYPSSIQPTAILLTPHESTLYISWNQHPLPQAWSTAKKMTYMKALAITIHDAYPTVVALQFLVNHQQAHDDQLDFSHAWPIAELV